MHIIALTTCHNRREKTLQVLEDLYSQSLPAEIKLSIVVVDDGSTDKTSEFIAENYPNVEILKGSGSLYWAGGIRFGWENAIKESDYDALLAFNDDIRLKTDALHHLIVNLEQAKFTHGPNVIVSGAFSDSLESVVTYGGFKKASNWYPLKVRMVPPDGTLQEIYTMNMNFSLISKSVIDNIGFLARYFEHKGADTEFGIRLSRYGGKVFLTQETVGYCERNPAKGTSFEEGISRFEKLRRLKGIKEEPLAQRKKYLKSYIKVFWPIFFPIPYLKALLAPSLRVDRNANNLKIKKKPKEPLTFPPDSK